MLELPKAAEQMDESEFIQHGLTVAEDLTGSRISFLCFVHADQQDIDSVSWSQGTQRGASRGLADLLCSSRIAEIWICAAAVSPRSGSRPCGSARRCSSTPSKQASLGLDRRRLPGSNG